MDWFTALSGSQMVYWILISSPLRTHPKCLSSSELRAMKAPSSAHKVFSYTPLSWSFQSISALISPTQSGTAASQGQVNTAESTRDRRALGRMTLELLSDSSKPWACLLNANGFPLGNKNTLVQTFQGQKTNALWLTKKKINKIEPNTGIVPPALCQGTKQKGKPSFVCLLITSDALLSKLWMF